MAIYLYIPMEKHVLQLLVYPSRVTFREADRSHLFAVE